MTLDELQIALDECLDVERHAVEGLLISGNRNARLMAEGALAKTAIRQALYACARLASEQQYSDQGTLAAIERLSAICDIDEPVVETLKQLGLQAAAAGQFEKAMQHLQSATDRAITAGQRSDKRSRRTMRYIHDAQINDALRALAAHFAPPSSTRPAVEPLRLSLICSALQDEDAPSMVTLKHAEHFRVCGFDVELVSTEAVASDPFRITARAKAMGFPFIQVRGKTWEERARYLIGHYQANPANAIYYSASGNDHLAKLGGCVGLAPVQVWENKGLEPQCGKYDAVFQSVSPEQETKTFWTGRSVFLGQCVALGEEIDAAQPLSRASIGVPEGAVLLATFGRMEKCITPSYLMPVATILAEEPRSWLILAGRDAYGAVRKITDYFRSRGVLDRVVYLGPRQSDGPSLLKTVDVYLDTHPWPGGQSLMDAMQAGLPIVAFKASGDTNLDPSGVGALSAYAEVMLTGLTELADPADLNSYVRIARAFIANASWRHEIGEKLHQKVSRDCSIRERTQRAAVFLRELIARGGSDCAP